MRILPIICLVLNQRRDQRRASNAESDRKKMVVEGLLSPEEKLTLESRDSNYANETQSPTSLPAKTSGSRVKSSWAAPDETAEELVTLLKKLNVVNSDGEPDSDDVAMYEMLIGGNSSTWIYGRVVNKLLAFINAKGFLEHQKRQLL
jgi:hypothetical protein